MNSKCKSEGGHKGCTENKKSQSKTLEESYDDKTHDFLKVFLKLYSVLAVLGLCCCTRAFSSCSEQGLLSSCSAQASLVAEHGLLGAWAQYLWHMGLAAPRHVESSRPGMEPVLCIGRQILNHWTTTEVQNQ